MLAPMDGKQMRSVEPEMPTQLVGKPPTGAQVVDVQPMHSGPRPLQHERQNDRFGSMLSMMQTPHIAQKFETSQRSPGAPVGVQVPPTQP
jgi:hypothetical protein